MIEMFPPTYLYIKQHSVTGLKYLGKTINNPYKYNGSGKYWSKHIKKHGKEHVKTLWCKLFTDKEEISKIALALSEMYDIVDSLYWANMKLENGLDGLDSKSAKKYTKGIPKSDKHKKQLSLSLTGHAVTEETKKKLSFITMKLNSDGVCGFSLGHASKAGSIGGKSKSKVKVLSSNKNLEKTRELHKNSVWVKNEECKTHKRISKHFLDLYLEYGWIKGMYK